MQHKCNNGKIFNTITRSFEICKECADKRAREVREGFIEELEVDLSEYVGFTGIQLSPKLVYESIIPVVERTYIEEDMLTKQEETLLELYRGYLNGRQPTESYVFGIGVKGCIERLVYPMYAAAYRGGMSVTKFRSISDIGLMVDSNDEGLSEVYSADVLFVMIPEGCSKGDIQTAKGVMQTRAMHGKPTHFVTTWSIQACSALLAEPTDRRYSLAQGVFALYKHRQSESSYVRGLYGTDNSRGTYGGTNGGTNGGINGGMGREEKLSGEAIMTL